MACFRSLGAVITASAGPSGRLRLNLCNRHISSNAPFEEASKYFRIGENKLRKLAEENPTAGWVIMNGNRIQIKRKQFEKIIDTLDVI